jgi:hypothetical protein
MANEKIMVAGCDVLAYLIECPPVDEDLTEEERIEMAQYIEKLFCFSEVYDQFDNLGQIYWLNKKKEKQKLKEADAIINKLSDEELAKLGLIRFSKS